MFIDESSPAEPHLTTTYLLYGHIGTSSKATSQRLRTRRGCMSLLLLTLAIISQCQVTVAKNRYGDYSKRGLSPYHNYGLYSHGSLDQSLNGISRICDVTHCHGMLLNVDFPMPFYGHLYVPGANGSPYCSVHGHGKRKQTFFVPFTFCGMKRADLYGNYHSYVRVWNTFVLEWAPYSPRFNLPSINFEVECHLPMGYTLDYSHKVESECSNFFKSKNVLPDVPIGRSCLDTTQCLGGDGAQCQDVGYGQRKCGCITGYEARRLAYRSHSYDKYGYHQTAYHLECRRVTTSATVCEDTCAEITCPVGQTCHSNVCAGTCLLDADCTDTAAPVCCNGICVACQDDDHCTDSDLPACVNGTCIACATNTHCMNTPLTPVCCNGVCVACQDDDDCTDSDLPACVNGTCIACATNTHCSMNAATPVCCNGVCVACQNDAGCTAINANLPACTSGTCEQCNMDSHCFIGLPRCVNKACVECIIDTDCATGETCDDNLMCVAGCTDASCMAMDPNSYCPDDIACACHPIFTEDNGVCTAPDPCDAVIPAGFPNAGDPLPNCERGDTMNQMCMDNNMPTGVYTCRCTQNTNCGTKISCANDGCTGIPTLEVFFMCTEVMTGMGTTITCTPIFPP
ncbi:PREDICTED: uncharacterized protein LOC106805294 [Priapulus caudatus]|uniref:Uncharacterized protein LOC106805294 n=1 Tax=Priapulus caudatus TaxID=37621 RepID=A0ABM1DQU6_PRICU|nr:PREDICTED: uncharacterized protein LOC106805294 [Priapulus caudatus]